ncbi:MAG: hypothetical protein ACKVH8_23425 [Pirellulales bacterium]
MQFKTRLIPIIGFVSFACWAIDASLLAQDRTLLTAAMERADQEELPLSAQNKAQEIRFPKDEIGWPELQGLSNPYASTSGNRYQSLGLFPSKLGFFHSDPDDPDRYLGQGSPLIGTSWRNRPYHADMFFGSLLTGDLERNVISQRSTAISGIRIGYDFDHYWGSEIRFATADARVSYAADPTLASSTHCCDNSFGFTGPSS